MKKKFIFSILLIHILFALIINNLYSQDFKQLIIEDDTVTKSISIPGDFKRFNAFGNFKYNLFLANSNDLKRIKNGNLSKSKYSESTTLIWKYVIEYSEEDMLLFFPVLNTETNKFNFLELDYQKYLPVAFMNDDTLILKKKEENKFIGYRLSNKTIVTLSNKIQELLNKVPTFYDNYRYKVNKNYH